MILFNRMQIGGVLDNWHDVEYAFIMLYRSDENRLFYHQYLYDNVLSLKKSFVILFILERENKYPKLLVDIIHEKETKINTNVIMMHLVEIMKRTHNTKNLMVFEDDKFVVKKELLCEELIRLIQLCRDLIINDHPVAIYIQPL